MSQVLFRISIIFGAALLFAKSGVSAPVESDKTFKIAERRDGSLTVDGRSVRAADIDGVFREIVTEHGHVRYYREAPAESADSTTTDILRAGEKYNVVIRLVNRADFSDAKQGRTKAVTLNAPKPEYPYEARRKHLTGAGIFVLHVDPYTGVVNSVKIEKSTGVALLDNAARAGFENWRFKPNTMKTTRVKIPVTYTLSGVRTQF